MLKWLVVCLGIMVAGGCLEAMGVGPAVLGLLLLVLALMVGIALLIAWPFLRKDATR